MPLLCNLRSIVESIAKKVVFSGESHGYSMFVHAILAESEKQKRKGKKKVRGP